MGSRCLCWRCPNPGTLRPSARRAATSSSAACVTAMPPLAAPSRTAAISCIADSTAAPWNSPNVNSPAAAAAGRVAPPDTAVRAANTDGGPAPWSMLATITASISRAVAGSGRPPV